MLKEAKPLIPADVRKFFPKEGGAFKPDVPDGYAIDAYMGIGEPVITSTATARSVSGFMQMNWE